MAGLREKLSVLLEISTRNLHNLDSLFGMIHVRCDWPPHKLTLNINLPSRFQKMIQSSGYHLLECMLPHIVSELRSIWITSHYYSEDANMQHLMHLISNTFTQALKQKANLDTLFQISTTAAYHSVRDGSHFLQMWIQQYFEMRAEIEKSNAGSRWEFKRDVLFAEVKHFIKIYDDLATVFDMFVEIENLLGPRIKSLIRQPVEVFHMLEKLNRCKAFFAELDYDIFRIGFVEYWDASLEEFRGKISKFEEEVMSFIDRCIEMLKSPSDGIVLINSILEMKTRARFVEHIKRRGDSVMKQLISFIGEVEHEFLKHRNNPPINGNNARHIGAILWCRSLFKKLKDIVVVFKQVSCVGGGRRWVLLFRHTIDHHYY